MSQLDPSPIPLIFQLTTALHDAGVTYCHWKSNAAIELTERGETDLDLLVARSHARKFSNILSSYGFVAAERHHAAQIPGVTHFFGYDATVDRFVHVHAHYQLVLGHDRTKNYRLPIEESFLASVSRTRVFPTPSPEFEYVVFVIRMVLKYAILDEILWNAARGRRAQLKPSERDEFDQLIGVIDRDAVAAIVVEHLPFVDAALFAAAEDVVKGATSVWRKIAVARKMQSTLEAHARTAPTVDGLLRVWRRVVLSVRRRTGAKSGYRLATGGAIIAIMGGDGAGKTTAIKEIGDWLEGDFDLIRIHLGKPPWSWTTLTVRGGLKIADAAVSLFNGGAIPSASTAPTQGRDASFSEYRRLVWFACKSRDRYLAYRKAQRAANKGSIVISDRFPHPALWRTDVPQIGRLTGDGHSNRFLRGLTRFENRFHRLVGLPELAIVLILDPEEAARRKKDEPYSYVVERSREIRAIDWAGAGVHVVDAHQTPEAIVAELKDIIWASLA